MRELDAAEEKFATRDQRMDVIANADSIHRARKYAGNRGGNKSYAGTGRESRDSNKKT
jgi:hypothetical protein